MSEPAQVSRAEQAQRVRDHYERIWQKGGEGWTSAVDLAADAWEREPALLDRVGQLEEALVVCVKAIELIEAAYLKGDEYAPHSLPAQAMAMARRVLDAGEPSEVGESTGEQDKG